EETFWWLIANNFGIPVNREAFEKIARSVTVSILAKHKSQVIQIEALLFGQAGLLDKSFTEAYPLLLKKEYRFLQKKYSLEIPLLQLYFLRMRPANFPSVRLAQLAMLVHTSSHLFSKIIVAESLTEIKKLLDITANDYWHNHYNFDEEAILKVKKVGAHMVNNILINTVVPVLFAYGQYHNDQKLKDRAICWLEDIAAEKNSITRGFEKLKFRNDNSFDSQFFIQLKNKYCNKKRCLECAIGSSILGKDGTLIR
ncbi:MAG: DUF2851 family protein, partial [Chitinophagaceae bacterium]|nr:DUF2851 family protein [Chitinophagaceae bacterium]